MSTTKQQRELALNQWARHALTELHLPVDTEFKLVPASDDASFRRYFRGASGEGSFIFVDAPPEQEDSAPFVHVARLLRAAGLNAPVVYREDMSLGFMMLTDFGDRLYYHLLPQGGEVVDALYDDAVDTIVTMQQMGSPGSLGPYDETLLRQEMELFTDWFLPLQLGLDISAGETRAIARVFDLMVANALGQPAAFVHRDFHCRNLMVVEEGNPGVIDFQDAVVGAVTYDLVSLLKDCYHRFPVDEVNRRVDAFRLRLMDEKIIGAVAEDTFTRWFDLMGMQRHIKVAGIFSRLNLRDGKPRYLADIPRVVSYIVEVCERYEDLRPFGKWLEDRVVPGLDSLLPR